VPGTYGTPPWPDGATEFVDLHRDAARAAGIRYAVMVVNNYAGMPFSRLARGFAGIMQRDDAHGSHFNPRTVALRFALQGENGVFMPLVLDVVEDRLHWLDVHARGQFALNNVANAKRAISTICPGLMTYFASGTRASVSDIALLHAAARCDHVVIRGAVSRTFARRTGEQDDAFLARLRAGHHDPESTPPSTPEQAPVFAILADGDLDLPEASPVYALFPGRSRSNLSASDLLS
jgi:hypothetical protein